MKMAGEESRLTEIELRKERRTLKVEIKDQQLAHEENIKTLKIVSGERDRNCMGSPAVTPTCIGVGCVIPSILAVVSCNHAQSDTVA